MYSTLAIINSRCSYNRSCFVTAKFQSNTAKHQRKADIWENRKIIETAIYDGEGTVLTKFIPTKITQFYLAYRLCRYSTQQCSFVGALVDDDSSVVQMDIEPKSLQVNWEFRAHAI